MGRAPRSRETWRHPFKSGSRSREREAGQAIVEFALISIVLLTMAMGILDLGRVFFAYEALANSAREGARYCALHPGNTAGTQARAGAEVGTLVAIDTSATTCPANTPGTPVTVTVRGTFTPVTPLIRLIVGGTGSIALEESAMMVVW